MNAEPVPFPLTDLPPDLQFNRLYASEEWDLTFSYKVKRLALGPQVAAQWGSWDHAFQWPFHLQRFAERCFYKIVWQGRSVGTVALTEDNGHVRFEEFYILPEVHRNGIGTRVLKHVLNLTGEAGLPVKLIYLKSNPVGALYRRNGFLQVGATTTHFLMEHRPAQPEPEVGQAEAL